MSEALYGPTWTTRHLWSEMADCPFCMANAEEFHISITYGTDMKGHVRHFMGECAECGALGPTADSELDALLKWNASRTKDETSARNETRK